MELGMEEACKFLSLTMNYDWERLFVGNVPANFCYGSKTGRGYFWVLSLQIFVIDYGTMTGRGYLWVLPCKLKIKNA